MNKKLTGIISLAIIGIFIAYIVFDIASGNSDKQFVENIVPENQSISTNWIISSEHQISYGELLCLEVSGKGRVLVGGNNFIAALDSDLKPEWQIDTEETIYAICEYDNIIYAATQEKILLLDALGNIRDEWGPYDDDAILTSIAANKDYIAIADAGNQLVFVLDKDGALVSIAGHHENEFIIPSAYFDVFLTEYDTLVVANTGKRNIEFRTIEGELIRSIGEEGDELEFFCGCCNPSHFSFMPDGNIVSAEKGINRIKIIRPDGSLLEPVAQPSHFMASIPLDLAVSDEGLIYGANGRDSKIYIFQKLY